MSGRNGVHFTGIPRNSVDQLLYKMGKAGEVLKAGRGRYIHPDNRHLIESETHKADKIDKKIRSSLEGGGNPGSGAAPTSYQPGATDKNQGGSDKKIRNWHDPEDEDSRHN